MTGLPARAFPDFLHHDGEGYYWIILTCQMELQQQRTHADKASDGEHADRGGSLFLNVGLAL